MPCTTSDPLAGGGENGHGIDVLLDATNLHRLDGARERRRCGFHLGIAATYPFAAKPNVHHKTLAVCATADGIQDRYTGAHRTCRPPLLAGSCPLGVISGDSACSTARAGCDVSALWYVGTI